MITLKNQIALKFKLGPIDDFISIEDFQSMEVIKNAGGLRPLLKLSFELRNADVIPYLNKGNVLIMSWGIETPSSDPLFFEIEGIDNTKLYRVGSQVNMTCSMYNPKFTSYIHSNNYGELKGFEVIQKIADESNMKLVTNVTRSNDKQTWIQTGRTNWDYLDYVFWRTYKDEETFFIYAFDNDNIYYYDMREHLKTGPKWVLSVSQIDKNTENNRIVNIGAYKADDSNAGPLMQLSGKNVTTYGYNVDTGMFSEETHKLKSFTAMETNKINNLEDGCQTYEYAILTGNEHENSIKAKSQNKRNNLLYSCHTVYVPVPVQYRDFKLLDIVQLLPADPDMTEAGLYLITGIVNQYRDGKYQTNLVLNREGVNGMRGDALPEE